jgi:hypothetical protein
MPSFLRRSGFGSLRRIFVLFFVFATVTLGSLQARSTARLLYVHGAAGSQDAGDPDIIRMLSQELGCEVTKRIDTAIPDAQADARDFDLVFISSSVFSKNVAGKYREHSIPVLVGEALTFPDEWMAMAKHSHFEGGMPHLDAVRIVPEAEGHPLAAGKSAGVVTVSAGKAAIWGWGADLGPEARIIAVATVDPASGGAPAAAAVVEFVYEKGARLTDGTPAKGLRIGIPWIDSEGPMFGERPNSISADGRDLLRAAVRYALSNR